MAGKVERTFAVVKTVCCRSTLEATSTIASFKPASLRFIIRERISIAFTASDRLKFSSHFAKSVKREKLVYFCLIPSLSSTDIRQVLKIGLRYKSTAKLQINILSRKCYIIIIIMIIIIIIKNDSKKSEQKTFKRSFLSLAESSQEKMARASRR